MGVIFTSGAFLVIEPLYARHVLAGRRPSSRCSRRRSGSGRSRPAWLLPVVRRRCRGARSATNAPGGGRDRLRAGGGAVHGHRVDPDRVPRSVRWGVSGTVFYTVASTTLQRLAPAGTLGRVAGVISAASPRSRTSACHWQASLSRAPESGPVHSSSQRSPSRPGRPAYGDSREFVMTVKANMPTLHRQLRAAARGPSRPPPPPVEQEPRIGGARRTIKVALVPAVDRVRGRRPGRPAPPAPSPGRGKKTVEVVYLITSSRSAGPATLAACVRGHWHIETSSTGSATSPTRKTNPWSEQEMRPA